MNNPKLAPLFLDDQPVTMTDAKPKLDAILAAVGKPDDTKVQWLTSPSGEKARELRPEEVVDRTAEPSKPIYLTSTGGKGTGAGASDSQGEADGSFKSLGATSLTKAEPAWDGKPGEPMGEDRPADPQADLQTEGKDIDLQTEAGDDPEAGGRKPASADGPGSAP